MKFKFSAKNLINKLVKMNSTPHEIALGVSIGVFIAVVPVYGFHTLSIIFLALLLPRVNKIAMVLGTNISIPPTMPIITWVGYNIGRKILPGQYPDINLSIFKNISINDLINMYLPLFVGSIVLGIILSVAFYFPIFWYFKNRIKWNKQ